MSAMESLCHLIGAAAIKFSQVERIILEAELFSQICAELKENYRKQYRDYFRLMKFTIKMETEMLEANFTRLVIKDILQTREYTVEGLAQYTGIHEDVIHEVMCGRNTNPSAVLLQRAIDLHRTVRRDLYQAIIQKIVTECYEGSVK
jgi:hypothetical protein